MMSANSWTVVFSVWLAGCAGSAPALRSRGGTAVVTGVEACRDPTALVLLCGKRACAFYRCRDVALLGDAPREAMPYGGTPDQDASVQTAAPRKVVLASGYVGVVPEVEYEVEPLPSDSPMGPGHTGPVFIIPWGPSFRLYPLPPGLREYADQLLRLPHIEHHLFPPEEEFRVWLASKGIAAEAWTIPVTAEDYFQIHEGPKGDSWSAAWREFMRANPHATRREIWTHAGELCVRFGVFETVFDGPRSIARPKAAGEEAVTFVGIDPAVTARVDRALAECAKLASAEVLARRFNGRSPTPGDCREQVGRDEKGRPISLAQQLGIEMHKVALACARKRLEELRPSGFSIEPRYRYDQQTRRATPMSPEEEEYLLREGLLSELLGTIVPDVVLHAGNPARVQDVYDFKFPCVDPDVVPRWGKYPPGHPYQGESQGKIYEEALGAEPARVTPRRGVTR